MKTYFECLLVAWIVNAYIYEYAAEALTEIRIRMPRYRSIDFYSFMRKPFPKVVKVCIELYRWPKDSEELVSHRKIVEMLLQRTLWCDKYRRSFPGLRTRWVWNAGANPNYTFLSMNLHRHSQVIQLIPDTSLFQCISDMPNQFNLAFRGLTNNTFLKDGSKMIGFSFHKLEYLNFIDIVVANMIIFRHCHFCPSEWSIVEYSNHSWQLSQLQQFTSKLKKAHSGSFENVEWFGRTGDQKHYSS